MSSTDLQVLERAVAAERATTAGARWPLSLRAGAWLFWTMLAGNGAFIVWMWLHAGGISGVHGRPEAFTSLGRITGLIGVYLALVQVLMLSRLRPLERYVGFDRLTSWHRVNGKVCVSLIVAHAVLITVGYALAERISVPSELSRLLSSYPGMVTATIGTVLMVAVVISSLVIVRRRMRYESWHLVHFLIYAGIALGYLHQIPTGNEFAAHPAQAAYWISLYAATLATLLVYRVALPIRDLFRYELTVKRVAGAGPHVTSVEVGGRGLHRLHAVAGQFMVWRFLTPGRWWQAHPFSLSTMPDGHTLRLTAKAVGDFTDGLSQLQRGTRVMVEGPFGTLTAAAMRTEKALLIAGGIGITPLRALFEEMAGSIDVALIYRAVSKREFVLRDELEEIARRWGATLHLLPGDHRRREGAKLLSPASLRSLVDDIAERDVYVCGPSAMMEQVAASLAALKVPEDQIHSERFALAT